MGTRGRSMPMITHFVVGDGRGMVVVVVVAILLRPEPSSLLSSSRPCAQTIIGVRPLDGIRTLADCQAISPSSRAHCTTRHSVISNYVVLFIIRITQGAIGGIFLWLNTDKDLTRIKIVMIYNLEKYKLALVFIRLISSSS